MKFVQKSMVGLGGILLAAILIATLAPKTARGVVATLVQVANTSANPVPSRDVDNGARQAISLTAASSTLNVNQISFSEANANGVAYVVPAGKRLVVEFISGRFAALSGANVVDEIIVTGKTSSGTYSDFLTPNLIASGDVNQDSIYQIAQPMRAYYDAGSQIGVAVFTDGNLHLMQFTLRGYLVDCTDACS